jgi:hypothetical protein
MWTKLTWFTDCLTENTVVQPTNVLWAQTGLL